MLTRLRIDTSALLATMTGILIVLGCEPGSVTKQQLAERDLNEEKTAAGGVALTDQNN